VVVEKMIAAQYNHLLRDKMPPAHALVPALAGCLMLVASLLPWLRNSLEGFSNAWGVPVDLGWNLHIAVINYGMLCLCGALSSLLVAYACWKPGGKGGAMLPSSTLAAWLCLAPVLLLLVQYLMVDMGAVNQLAQQKIQMLLVEHHYGYKVASPLLPLTPFTVDISTFQGRLVLLLDQLSMGFLLPCASAWMLFDYKQSKHTSLSIKHRKRMVVAGIVIIVILLWPGRAFAGIVCEKYARGLLAGGNYAKALSWLDTAATLNPTLNEVAFYHVERGQALYYLYPNQQSDDSRVYLVFSYQQQGDKFDVYQQIVALWYTDSNPPSFVRDEISLALEQLTEGTGPLKTQDSTLDVNPQALKNDEAALRYLQLLVQVDPHNIYGPYMIGRIDYDVHNYLACKEQMAMALQLSGDADFQSSVYTYMALSDAGLGDYASERALLLTAVRFDSSYRNNTAREELSGLR
jgi:tetratricopeptide (TPR) repeat protein